MPDNTTRQPDQLRPVEIRRYFTRSAPGSVLYQAGRTTILCTASIQDAVPEWRAGRGAGWITAEYNMLPGSTNPRKQRDRLKVDGRTTEIQRLIGRSFRAIIDLAALGERTVTIDCDVLEADGGTRTAAITGGFIALVDALDAIRPRLDVASVLTGSVAAVSVGIIDGQPRLDLDYAADVAASVDMNVIMTGACRYVEIQGTGEEATFDEEELAALLRLAKKGIRELTQIQKAALQAVWPFD